MKIPNDTCDGHGGKRIAAFADDSAAGRPPNPARIFMGTRSGVTALGETWRQKALRL